MRIAVLGTGPVGQAVAGKLAELGHDVTVGTRSVAAAMARAEPDAFGNPPFPAWVEQHPEVGVATLADAAAAAELVVNATKVPGPSRRWRRPGRSIWRARCSSTSPIRWTSPPACPRRCW